MIYLVFPLIFQIGKSEALQVVVFSFGLFACFKSMAI